MAKVQEKSGFFWPDTITPWGSGVSLSHHTTKWDPNSCNIANAWSEPSVGIQRQHFFPFTYWVEWRVSPLSVATYKSRGVACIKKNNTSDPTSYGNRDLSRYLFEGRETMPLTFWFTIWFTLLQFGLLNKICCAAVVEEEDIILHSKHFRLVPTTQFLG